MTELHPGPSHPTLYQGVKEASSPSLLCPILQAQVHLRLRWVTWKGVLKAGWHKEPLLWAEACLIHFPHPQPSQFPTGCCPGLALTGPFPTAATGSAENPESDHTLPCSHILSGSPLLYGPPSHPDSRSPCSLPAFLVSSCPSLTPPQPCWPPLHLEPTQHLPTSGPLHLPFLLLGTLSPTSLQGWCPLTLEVPPFQKAPSDPSVQSSSFPYHPPRPPSVEFLP